MQARVVRAPGLVGAVVVAALASCSGEEALAPELSAALRVVAVGAVHTCGVTATGEAFCWGWNRDGQLGDSTTRDTSVPVRVRGGIRFDSVAAGGAHTCGLATDGTAYCWGFNLSGQLGDSGTPSRSVPGRVAGSRSFRTVSAGGAYTCGVAQDGTAHCWGWNRHGQLGDGTNADRLTPVPVGGGVVFAAVTTGNFHACGLTPAGAAYCWGNNENGELGDGTTNDARLPTAVSGGVQFAQLAAGDDHTCGIAVGGRVYCWGSNGVGQLGDPESGAPKLTPAVVTGAITFERIVAGPLFTCAVALTGDAYCWGYNNSGQLGSVTTTTCFIGVENPVAVACATQPTLVSGGLRFRMLSAGSQHVCGIAEDGRAYCWGRGVDGQLGDGRSGDGVYSLQPVRVAGQP